MLPMYHLWHLFGLGVGTSASGHFVSLLCHSGWLGPATAFTLGTRDIWQEFADLFLFPPAGQALSSPDCIPSITLLLPLECKFTLPTIIHEMCMMTIGKCTLTFHRHINSSFTFDPWFWLCWPIAHDITRHWRHFPFIYLSLNSSQSWCSPTGLFGIGGS